MTMKIEGQCPLCNHFKLDKLLHIVSYFAPIFALIACFLVPVETLSPT